MSKQTNPILDQGKQAREADLGHASCPYEMGENRALWLKGDGPEAKDDDED